MPTKVFWKKHKQFWAKVTYSGHITEDSSDSASDYVTSHSSDTDDDTDGDGDSESDDDEAMLGGGSDYVTSHYGDTDDDTDGDGDSEWLPAPLAGFASPDVQQAADMLCELTHPERRVDLDSEEGEAAVAGPSGTCQTGAEERLDEDSEDAEEVIPAKRQRR